jgi:ABC-type bacteriocin/lantibiotic exporter with double-glycine peptidase domain
MTLARLDEVVAALPNKLETVIGENGVRLSGGQKQRVAIARALAGDPTIVLADEPTAALDTHSGHAVMQLFVELAHERSRAIVIVTHDSRMLGYADRIVHIEDGRLASNEPSALGFRLSAPRALAAAGSGEARRSRVAGIR